MGQDDPACSIRSPEAATPRRNVAERILFRLATIIAIWSLSATIAYLIPSC
ncbi:MAG: hypothetical protein PHP55_10975 [Methanoculleus sp.]|nr:hypothetical protein [Methanoculleus sp.]